MDRCGVFIDVGYLYAAGGTVCIGEKTRTKLRLDIDGVVSMLAKRAITECGTSLLRSYWYDGAAKGVPTAEHRRAGLITDVKLRLGRLNSKGQQKGVDALIYRDLMTLARERAISHAYLFSGDGDLVEGVRAAQDLGTHVTLMYIQGAGQGASPDLLSEVDRRIRLERDDLAPFFTRAAVAESLAARDPMVRSPESDILASDPKTIARDHACEWIAQATDDDIQALVDSHPRIPQQLDVELLVRVEAALGRSLRGDVTTRHAIREAFWDALRSASESR